MAYYSFVVTAPHVVPIQKPMLLLDTGRNVFSVHVEDLSELLARFEEEGVVVQQMNRLDNHLPGELSDLSLEGLPLFGAPHAGES